MTALRIGASSDTQYLSSLKGTSMSVAIVTGGTRGLGRAMSLELKQAGHRVAAVYHGNDAAADRFHGETGISVFRWDIGDFDACHAGIMKVADELGPVSVLINNGGITRDSTLHKMTLAQ